MADSKRASIRYLICQENIFDRGNYISPQVKLTFTCIYTTARANNLATAKAKISKFQAKLDQDLLFDDGDFG